MSFVIFYANFPSFNTTVKQFANAKLHCPPPGHCRRDTNYIIDGEDLTNREQRTESVNTEPTPSAFLCNSRWECDNRNLMCQKDLYYFPFLTSISFPPSSLTPPLYPLTPLISYPLFKYINFFCLSLDNSSYIIIKFYRFEHLSFIVHVNPNLIIH